MRTSSFHWSGDRYALVAAIGDVDEIVCHILSRGMQRGGQRLKRSQGRLCFSTYQFLGRDEKPKISQTLRI